MNRVDPFYCSIFYFLFDLVKKLTRLRKIVFTPDLIHELIRVAIEFVYYKPGQVWILQHLVYIFIHEFFDLKKQWIVRLKNSIDLWKEFLCLFQKNCFKKFLLVAIIIMKQGFIDPCLISYILHTGT